MTRGRRRWIAEHRRDPFVKRSKDEGFRSRAAYKLLEIDRRDKILRPGITVVDLGASPGGWSQVAADRVGVSGRVIAVDVVPMKPIPGVEFIHGDLNDPAVLDALLMVLQRDQVGLVMSDMAPNASGIRAVDQPRAIQLNERALDICEQLLVPGGDFVVKMFEGTGKDAFVGELRKRFGHVLIRKPKASRSSSREIYLLGREYAV